VSAAPGPVGADAALRRVRLSACALEVSAALSAAQVGHLLLKGPVTAAWLYGAHAGPAVRRTYRDVDLLVDPRRLAAACAQLERLGFGCVHAAVRGVHRPDNEQTWRRDGLDVDVHTRLVGVPARRAVEAYDVLAGDAEPFALHGRSVQILSEPARAMHLALHVAQSRTDARAADDLERGLHLVGAATWQQAALLADRLGARPSFDAGLRRLPPAVRHRAPEPAAPTTLRLELCRRGALSEAVAVAALLEQPRAAWWAAVRRWWAREQPAPSRDGGLLGTLTVTGRLLAGLVQLASAAAAVRTGQGRRS